MFPDLGRVYVFKESLRAVWEMESKYDARMYLLRWMKEAKDTGIKELLKLVNLVESHMEGISTGTNRGYPTVSWKGSTLFFKLSREGQGDTAASKGTVR